MMNNLIKSFTPLIILLPSFLVQCNVRSQDDKENIINIISKNIKTDQEDILKSLPEDSIIYGHPMKRFFELFFVLEIDKKTKLTTSIYNKGFSNPEDVFKVILLTYKKYLEGKDYRNEKFIDIIKEESDRTLKLLQANADKDTINGIYIPKDLEDSFNQLDKLLDDSTRTVFTSWDEDYRNLYYYDLQDWIARNWKLGVTSRLRIHLIESGIYNMPDKMAEYILVAYHRRLNEKELNLEELKKKYNK